MAAQSLKFAPRLELLADQVHDAILQRSPGGFNGVHFRAERDAILAGFLAGNSTVEVCCERSIVAVQKRQHLAQHDAFHPCCGIPAVCNGPVHHIAA